MKLLARVKRIKVDREHIILKAVFPIGTFKASLPENIVKRNIGPRPWSEGYYVDSYDRKVVLYWHGRA